MADFTTAQLTRLRDSVKTSYRLLAPYRRHRVDALRQYVGMHWSDDGAADKVPVNFLELAIGIYSHHLASRVPRVLVTTPNMLLKPLAMNLQLALNRLISAEEIDLATTLRLAVVDAMFSMGIVKLGMMPGAEVEIGPEEVVDAGLPFAEVISLDDWVHDVTAKRWDTIQYCGNRYYLPVSEVKGSELYNQDSLKDVEPEPPKAISSEGGDERAQALAGGIQGNNDTFRDKYEVMDLWIPGDNVVVTLLAGDNAIGKAPLRVVEWQGPRRGPYHRLTFTDVPDSTMPLPPVALWMDLHDLSNRVFRKLGRQSDRQKTIGLVQRGGGENDGDRVVKANDGEVIGVDNPQNFHEARFGGVDAPQIAFMLQIKDLFAYFGGNLDTLGGLSPMASTVGQEGLINENASKRMADMQNKVHAFDTAIVSDLGFYLWTDKVREYTFTKKSPIAGLSIESSLTPEDRASTPFSYYEINVQPYSMQDLPPSARLSAIQGFIQNVLVPLMPMAQAQGVQIKFEGLARKFAAYSGIEDDLDDFLEFASVPPEMQGMQPTGRDNQAAPAFTRHVSERVSRPGATRHGKDNAMLQMLMGGGLQPAEAAVASRPIG